jgi:hypothetical protein
VARWSVGWGLVAVTGWADAAAQELRTAPPGASWCALVADSAPGDVVELTPGVHVGGCVIGTGGTPGAPVIVRAAPGPSSAVVVPPIGVAVGVSVDAPDVSLEGLVVDLQGRPGVAIAVRSAGVRVDGVTVTGVDGAGLDAAGAVGGLTVVESRFRYVATPIQVDCVGCEASPVVVHRNHVVFALHTGIRVHSDGDVDIGENVVIGPMPVGISATGSGTIAGDVVVDADLGVAADGVFVLENALIRASRVGVSLDGGVVRACTVSAETPFLVPPEQVGSSAVIGVLDGVWAPDVVRCGAACFVDLSAWDLRPAPDGPLVDLVDADAVPAGDVCGVDRADGTIGAIALGAAGPSSLYSADHDALCAAPPVVEGCGAGSAATLWWAPLWIAYKPQSRRRRRATCRDTSTEVPSANHAK